MLSDYLTLYHGSIYSFDTIDLANAKPFKDFGAGFYTTREREHALNLAARNKKIAQSRLLGAKTAEEIKMWIYVFELPEMALETFSVRRFSAPDREWVRFVAQNRKSKYPQHSYDLVIGPTANDSTLAAINGYWGGLYGDIESDAAIDTLLRVPQPYKLPFQYMFATEEAASQLVLTRKEEIS